MDPTEQSLDDIRKRLSHLEHQHLQLLNHARETDNYFAEANKTMTTIIADRDDGRRKLTDATQLPLDLQKQMAILETRLRACEGAIGANPPAETEPVSDPAHADLAKKTNKHSAPAHR